MTSRFLRPKSPSIKQTLNLEKARALAKLTLILLLPTPPLPEVTTITLDINHVPLI